MIISSDLRMAINAAAKNQKEPTDQELHAALRRSIDTLTARYPVGIKKALEYHKKKQALLKQARALDAKIEAIVDPLGLSLETSRKDNKPYFTKAWGREAEASFLKAGGVLPPPTKRKWKPDQVIAELAAADPKDLQKILKPYGIHWA